MAKKNNPIYVYIKKNHSTHFVEFSEALNPELYDNLGSTWQDYLDNKWVILSDEQVAFRDEHPNASVKEVYDMEIVVPVRTLEMAKQEKLWAIEDYDRSDHVNSFTIDFGGGVTQEAWITPDQRSNYKNSLDSAELLGLEEVHPVFNGQQLTLSLQVAKMALAQIQIYADRCYIVTETHKTNVQALDSVEAVDAYDHTANYPNKLTFPI